MSIPSNELITAIEASNFIPVSRMLYPKNKEFIGYNNIEDRVQFCIEDDSGTTGLGNWVTHWYPCPNMNEFYE